MPDEIGGEGGVIVTVHKINMIWNAGAGEVDLGTCYLVDRPQRGDLISFNSDRLTDRRLAGGYFVVPAEGPWRA